MKKVSQMKKAILLCIGLAVAFQCGKSTGFKTGSEWALVQADILAREAGVFMPVYLDDNDFRIVVKQPRGVYKRAWERADKYVEKRSMLKTAKLQDLDRKSVPEGNRHF